MQMAANTPGPTFIDAFCFDLGVGTAPDYANKGHSVCFNQEVVATCATITNRWKTFSTQPPGLMWFSTIGSAYIHSVSVNNVGNMIKWEDDLLWRQNIQDALWNYCWTIDIDFGDDSDVDRHTPATYLDCKSGNTCTNVKNQWVSAPSCQSCYGGYAEFPPEDRGINQGFAAVEEMPTPKMNAPESEKLREALKKFEETRAKLVAEGKWD
ncbi:hypothetical protein K7432_017526 [Basidiobolus ranarum]|uniref:Uncharacterized protein n=1 Tax=Basidiobolus ranarum TaxID=34480 RepID=A0ABR2VL15_9FUNG